MKQWEKDLKILHDYYGTYPDVAGSLEISVSGTWLAEILSSNEADPSKGLRKSIKAHANGVSMSKQQDETMEEREEQDGSESINDYEDWRKKLYHLEDVYPNQKALAKDLPFDISQATISNLINGRGTLKASKKEKILNFETGFGDQHRIGLEVLMQMKTSIQSMRELLDDIDNICNLYIDRLNSLEDHYDKFEET